MDAEGELCGGLRLPVQDEYTQDQIFEVFEIAEVCHGVRQLLVTPLDVIISPWKYHMSNDNELFIISTKI